MPVSARREAVIGVTVDPSKMDSGVDGARRKMHGLRKEVEDDERRAARAAAAEAKQRKKDNAKADARESDFVKGAVRRVGERAMDFGMDTVRDTVRDTIELGKTLTNIQIAGEINGAGIAKFREELLRTSSAIGVNVNQLAEGEDEFIRFTGHADTAREYMELLAKTMKATGASEKDIGGLLATFDSNMGLNASQAARMMDVLVKQAHLGSVEMKDFAGAMVPAMATYASMFKGGSTVEGMSHVTAMGQVLSSMTHDASESANRIDEITSALNKHKNVERLRGIGIDPYDKQTGKMRDMLGILDQIKAKNMSMEALSGVFHEERARSAIAYLTEHLDLVHQIDQESVNSGQVNADMMVRASSDAGKYETAMVRLKNQIHETFSPEVMADFASAATSALDRVSKAIEFWRETRKDFRTDADHVNSMLEQMKDASPEAKEARAAMLERQNSDPAIARMSAVAHKFDQDSLFGTFMKYNPMGGGADIPAMVHTLTTDRFAEEAAGQRHAAAYQRDHTTVTDALGGELAGALNKVAAAISSLPAKLQTNISIAGDPIAKAVANAPRNATQKKNQP